MKIYKSPVSMRIPKDDSLPQLVNVLDSQWMTRQLIETGIVKDARDCIPIYLRYKPGTNCLTLYEVGLDDGTTNWIYSKAYSADRQSRPSDQLRLSAYLPDYRIALSRFPLDQQMPALRLLLESNTDSSIFKKLISSRKRQQFEESWGHWETIRYKPERRCLLRGTYRETKHRTRGFYARLYADSVGAQTAGWHRHFASLAEDRIKLPTCLSYHSKYRILLIKELRGTPLKEFFHADKPDQGSAIASSAQALAQFHRLTPPPGLSRGGCSKAAVKTALESLTSICKEHSAAVRDLATELVAQAPDSASPGLVHGDFYYDQVLIRPGKRVRLVDLDKLFLGDPLQDVANFCAHLFLLATLGHLPRPVAQSIEGKFLENYEIASGCRIRMKALHWFKTASLLQLSTAPFRRLRPNWPDEVGQMLDEVAVSWGGRAC